MADLLELVLAQINFRTRVFHRGVHCGNWQLHLEQSEKVLLHFVSEGGCEIDLQEQRKTIRLNQGDLLLFSKTEKHTIQKPKENITTEGGSADQSGLICAYVEFDATERNYLIEALPNCVVTPADAHQNNDWLRNLLELILSESNAELLASQIVIERLTDVLFIHIIRSYLSQNRKLTGFFAAYKDPILRRVLELIHREPHKPWTIADFASLANLSRSSFIEKFTRILGSSPIAYLTEQRLQYAYQQLCMGERKVLDLALDCGYETESSFSKAFKRRYNISPGTLKRMQR